MYFLSKDLFTKDAEYLDVTDPEAKNIYELRNNLEHKYCKIHWFKQDMSGDELRFDTLAYSVTEEYFSKTKHRFLIILLNLIKCSQILILKGFEHFYCWKILHVSLYISS